MTKTSTDSVDPALVRLRFTVLDAAAFLRGIDENLADGDQTAHQVFAHLVFWHREYVRIAGALAQGQEPQLRSGKYREMNALADIEFRDKSMSYLSKRFVNLQHQLEQSVCALPDPDVRFTLKQDSSQQTMRDWSPRIQAHVSSHVLRLRRALRKTTRPTRQPLSN